MSENQNFSFRSADRKPWVLTYLLAVGSTLATLGIDALLEPPLHGQSALVIFTIPIMVSAYVGGLGPGLLATTLSYFLVSYFLLDSLENVNVDAAAGHWQAAIVALAGSVISGLSEMLHRARRRGHQAEQTRAQVAAIVESSDDAIIGSTVDGLVTSWNSGAEKIFGFRAKEMIGRPIETMVPVERRAQHAEFFQRVCGGESLRPFETQRLHKNGVLVDVSLTVSPVKNSTGEIVGVSKLARDITDRKRAELILKEQGEQLHQADRRLAEIVQGMTEACFALNPEWHFTFANERSVVLLGQSRAAMIGHSIWTVFPEWVGTPVEANYRRARQDRTPVTFEIFTPGTERWLDIRLFPTAEGLAAFILDISDRKKAENSLRQSELKFAHAFANNPAAIALTRLDDGVMIDVNETWETLCGFTREEMLGKSARAIWPTPAAAERFVRELREKGVLRGWESEFRKKSGELFVAEVSSQVMSFDGERVILSTLVDITARKRAEESLRRQEALLRETGQIAKVGGWEFDPATGKGEWTEEVARIHGLDPKCPTGVELGLDFYHGKSRERIEAAVAAAVTQGTPYDLELELSAKDGLKWVRAIAHPVMENGRVLSVRGSLQDITDRKRAEAAVRESEAQFRQVVENINEVFWITDPEKRTILYVSPAYETIWGRTCESLLADPTNWLESLHPEDRARAAAAATHHQTKGTYDEVYRILRPDGNVRWVHDRAFPVPDDRGKIYRIVGTAEDVTDRKRAELLASVHHELTAVLSEATPLLDAARRMLEIVCRRLEWSLGDFWIMDRTAQTLRCVEIWHPVSPEFSAFAEVTRSLVVVAGQGLPGETWSTQEPRWIPDVTRDPQFLRQAQAIPLELRGGLAFPIQLRGEIFGVVEFFSPLSREPDAELMAMFAALGTQIGQFIERKQLEEKFRQAQKMEAIGTLAGGIAHDFNNVLSAIGGYTDLAKSLIGDDPEVQEYLDAVSVASNRATELVRQILAFSRLEEQQRKPIQLGPVIEEAVKLLRATIPTTIEFDVSLPREGPAVLGNPTQIHQVVMNLATNSAHAMKDRGGRLEVKLEAVEVNEHLAAMHPRLKPGSYLRLDVRDSGRGMDPATLSRIFDPFFTTKAPGEGTGLGLAVVHGIIQSHEGVIAVRSQLGIGTQFELYFPAYSVEIVEEIPPGITPQGHGERILLIDDEKALALMGQRALERLGYTVEAHTAPAAALAALRAQPNKYALVITDLTMPGATGTELAEQILKIQPRMPIILTTGYSATLTSENVRAIGIREMLVKPISFHALAEAVQRSINDGEPLD